MNFYGTLVKLGAFCQNPESNDVFREKIVRKNQSILASRNSNSWISLFNFKNLETLFYFENFVYFSFGRTWFISKNKCFWYYDSFLKSIIKNESISCTFGIIKNIYSQKQFQTYNYQINTTEQKVFQSPFLQQQ